MQARFDKHGRRLTDTGRGCGCQQCADAEAPRYERRTELVRNEALWSPIRRRLMGIIRRARGVQTA